MMKAKFRYWLGERTDGTDRWKICGKSKCEKGGNGQPLEEGSGSERDADQ